MIGNVDNDTPFLAEKLKHVSKGRALLKPYYPPARLSILVNYTDTVAPPSCSSGSNALTQCP